jgi:ABC-type antimicrobial peptide transport system permease subunit
MRTTLTLFIITLAVVLAVSVSAQGNNMTFFVSSTGSGMGGNLGGLAGADKLCQGLAAKAGAGNRTWRAYLSTSMPDVNARDRIGKGPWQNAKGVVIAANVDELHTDKANINNDTALDEMGRQINPQGAPNRHDILTGSTTDGKATTMTCNNWTSSAGDSSAMLGHHDRLTFGKPGSPWNSAHPSKGCSQENLVATGGAGLVYCFASN